MPKAKFKATKTRVGSREMFDLELLESPPTAEVTAELIDLSVRHSLPEAGGGLYKEMVRVLGGGTNHHLGGLHVPPTAFPAVVADLRQRGYEVRDSDS